MAVKRNRTPRAMRATMVTLSDEETTEAARQESMRKTLHDGIDPGTDARTDAEAARLTMPAPPAPAAHFSIELGVPQPAVDFKALFERGAHREALAGARQRLSVSPADTSALRVAQRSEEALLAELVSSLGGTTAEMRLVREAGIDSSAQERSILDKLGQGPLTLHALLATTELSRIETLDLVCALHDRGHLRVNLSEKKTTSSPDV